MGSSCFRSSSRLLLTVDLQDPDEKHFVIRMVDSFTFRGHLCIVTELLSINLYELVKANQFAGFSTVLIRRFTMQILASLSLLRHHRVVHCDLKPEVSRPGNLPSTSH